jgi:two-component system sensor histidine kinase SenX3
VNLSKVALNVVDTYRASADRRGVSLGFSGPDRAAVAGDGGQLALVVSNLVENAVHYTSSGGMVNLEISRDGQMVRLTVADTGIGIPPEDLAHVFDRFYRADPARSRNAGGSGLGLAIARAIVESHGGSIRARSAPGAGSRFTVDLPGLPGDRSPGSEAPTTTHAASVSN